MFLGFKYFAALLLTFYFSRKKGVEADEGHWNVSYLGDYLTIGFKWSGKAGHLLTQWHHFSPSILTLIMKLEILLGNRTVTLLFFLFFFNIQEKLVPFLRRVCVGCPG